MSRKQKQTLEHWLKSNGKFEQIMFTYAELSEMSRVARADMLDVMYYLRYERSK